MCLSPAQSEVSVPVHAHGRNAVAVAEERPRPVVVLPVEDTHTSARSQHRGPLCDGQRHILRERWIVQIADSPIRHRRLDVEPFHAALAAGLRARVGNSSTSIARSRRPSGPSVRISATNDREIVRTFRIAPASAQ